MSNPLLKRLTSLYIMALAGLLPLSALAVIPASAPEPFPQSTLETTTTISSPGHLVLFSPIREVNNQIRSETMARLPVLGEGRLYEIARDSSREKARDHYITLLQARGAQILYQCTGVECGRSNVWANQIFGQRVLYGRDESQDYLIAGSVASDGSRWLTLVYTVTRGNLREYVWLEHLEVEPGVTIPGLGGVDDRIHGPVIVSWQGGVTYRFDWSATDRRKIGEWSSSEGAVVVLTGFSSLGEDETLEQSLARARQATESLSEVLAKTGVSGEQQKLIVVGPAIPLSDPERQGDRVEVTVITR